MHIKEIKQNSVRDYRSVERGNITTPRIPLGMQPVFRNVVAFLRNADYFECFLLLICKTYGLYFIKLVRQDYHINRKKLNLPIVRPLYRGRMR